MVKYLIGVVDNKLNNNRNRIRGVRIEVGTGAEGSRGDFWEARMR